MSKLRLGSYLLPPGEDVLIRTLVRLFAQDPAFGWTFVSERPFDAIIMSSALGKSGNTASAPPARLLLKLTAAHEKPSAHTLPRPVKAEKLQQWLSDAALELARTDNAAAPPDRQWLIQQVHFKLLRWPPNTLLQNDAKMIRLSTLLSRRALRLSELATLSHQSIESCQLFIEKLMPMQLLHCESLVPLAGTSFGALQRDAVQPIAASPVPAAAQKTLTNGLISGIRKRLGLLSPA